MNVFSLMIAWLLIFPSQQKPALETMKVSQALYVKASLNNLFYLFEHIDADRWNEVLLPLGYVEKGLERRMPLHYTKGTAASQYHVITFDDQFGLVTLTWSDASGKIPVADALEKSLKANLQQESAVSKIYEVSHDKKKYWITIAHRKDGQRLQEEVSIENAR
jgi:hypothetical protein